MSGSNIALLGSGISGLASIGSGITGKRQGEINADILRTRGRQAERAARMENAKRVGAARARAAKGGGDPNVGSFADYIREMDAEGRVAALRERFAFDNAAHFTEARGMNALFESILGGGSTLLGALSQMDRVEGSDVREIPKAVRSVTKGRVGPIIQGGPF